METLEECRDKNPSNDRDIMELGSEVGLLW